MLIDRLGRPITYLRVSVTDRCNFRCSYCMPPEGVQRITHESVMRYEEIAQVVRVAAEQGIRRVRLTGGEPLVRLGLADLVRMIADIPGIEDISLTTNGLLLEKLALPLKEAGLNRINISLDTLQEEKFARITRGGSFETTWRGIMAAQAAGLRPIKINVVAIRGFNDDELPELAKLSLRYGWQVRFIELMPVNNQQPWGPGFLSPAESFLPISEIKAALAPLGLRPVGEPAREVHEDGPARAFTLSPDGVGRIGFISPLSEHFCGECNRMRITADGSFRPCLLHDEEVPFLAAMRAGEAVLPYLLRAVESKPAGHELSGGSPLPCGVSGQISGRSMRQIGG